MTVSNQNLFIQDHWVVSKNLTLHIGLRWEHQREYMHFREELPVENDAIYAGMRENVEFDDSGIAPRLGVTYNVENIGVFKFHFGRYFEYVGTGDYNNYARSITTDQYRMSSANIGQPYTAMTLYSEGTLGYNPDYNEDMQMEYNDEFLVSFERELFANIAFETTFVSRSASRSEVFPWSTWPMMVTIGGLGSSEPASSTCSSRMSSAVSRVAISALTPYCSARSTAASMSMAWFCVAIIPIPISRLITSPIFWPMISAKSFTVPPS